MTSIFSISSCVISNFLKSTKSPNAFNDLKLSGANTKVSLKKMFTFSSALVSLADKNRFKPFFEDTKVLLTLSIWFLNWLKSANNDTSTTEK